MQRALCALRFVQDHVRYFGFEEGIHGFKPHDPRDVFFQNLGDCKDKTFLLHAFLKYMDIESTPVLVDTTEGKLLPDSIPFPFAFNHVILRIEIGGEQYWVDSTITLQGGTSLSENFCPIYFWGLPLGYGETDLVEVPGHFMEKPTLIDTSFGLISKREAVLTITRKFEGHKADAMRRFLNQIGTRNYSSDFCDMLQRNYGQASLVKSPVLSDDREKNVLTLTQCFLIPTDQGEGKITLRAFSMALLNYLQNDLNPERNAPYSLNFPVWVKEHLHVETPYIDWEFDSDEYQCEHESLFYSYFSKMKGSSSDVYFELKHLKDHVPIDAIREYWEITHEIEQDTFFIFYVVESEEDSPLSASCGNIIINSLGRVGDLIRKLLYIEHVSRINSGVQG